MLVGDLAHDLFDEVFHCHESRDSAVFVHNECHVIRLGLKLAQRFIRSLDLGQEQRGAGNRRDGRGEGEFGLRSRKSGGVLDVGDALDVVVVDTDDGHARETLGEELPERLVHCGGGVERNHFGARDHHLTKNGVTEVEDRANEFAIFLLDRVGLGRLIDHAQQLALRVHLRARSTRRDEVADSHECNGDGSENEAHRTHEPPRPANDGDGVGAANAARARPNEHERDDHHRNGRPDERAVEVEPRSDEREGHQNGGEQLTQHAHEIHGVDVVRNIRRDAIERLLEPAFGQILNVSARQRLVRRVDGGAEPAHEDEHQRESREESRHQRSVSAKVSTS